MKIKTFLKNNLYFILFLIFGILIFTYPMLKSGFMLMPSNGYEAHFSTYLLEHSWLWLNQEELHRTFWAAPFAYPNENNIIYNGDMLFGIIPFYWILRVFIDNPFSIFQILIILLSIINYSSFYYFFKKIIKFSNLASSIGTFIFAFGLMRFYRIGQIQFLSQFLSIFALICILKVNKNNKPALNHLYFFLSSIFIALQFYTCYSLGFYFVFVGFWGIIFALLPKTSRDVVVNYFSNFYKQIIFYSISTFLLLLTLINHYIAIEQVRTIKEVFILSSFSDCWIRNLSILDSIFFSKIRYLGSPFINEASSSCGIFTMIISFFGIWKLKYAKGLPILLLILIFVCSCLFDGFFIWKYFYYITPGSAGIGHIIRISFIALIIFSIGIANLIEFLKNSNYKYKLLITAVLLSLITIEQIPFNKDINSAWQGYNWNKNVFISKINETKKEISSDCKVLLLEYNPVNLENFGVDDKKYKTEKLKAYADITALWAGLEKKDVYVLNQYFNINEQKEIQKIKNLCIIKKEIDVDKL